MKPSATLKKKYKYWERTKDRIDIMLNLSQSRHPGWSRFKVHALVFTLLSGAIKWNITNTLIKVIGNWIKNRFVAKYSLPPDFDYRRCIGGSVDQIITESRLDSLNILMQLNVFLINEIKE